MMGDAAITGDIKGNLFGPNAESIGATFIGSG